MNINLQTIALCVGALIFYNGWVSRDVKPSPDNPNVPVVVPDGTTINVIVPPGEVQVVAPSNPAVASASAGIKTALLSNPQFDPADAAKLARTWIGWKELIANDQYIKTTAEFHKIWGDASLVLLRRHNMAPKAYALVAPVSSTFDAAIKATGMTETSADMTPAIRAAIVSAVDAMAYQAWQAFIEGSTRPKAVGWIEPESKQLHNLLMAVPVERLMNFAYSPAMLNSISFRKKSNQNLNNSFFIVSNAAGRCRLTI